MFHWFGVITNTKGDSLPGWQVECVEWLDGSTVVPIYSDENLTPILTTSGISDRALADASGNYDFFVAEGTYSLRFYDANGVFQRMQRYLPMYGNAPEAAIVAMEGAQAARDEAVAASELAQSTAGGTVYATWTDLAAATGMAAGDSAVVFEDAGTHTDPVTSATVDNAGIYIYSASPAGWERVADTEAVKAADSADQAQAWAEGTLPGGAGTKSAKEHATDAAAEADAAALSAATAEAVSGPTYASTAAGLASTANGDLFAVNNGGIVTIYLNDGGTAVAQRDAVTTQALASTAPGKGASLVSLENGQTVQAGVEEALGLAQFAPLMERINSAQNDVSIVVLTDSTGNQTGEWIYLLANGSMKSAYPDWTITFAFWDTGTSDYAAATTLQTGTNGKTIKFYAGAIAGSAANYFAGPRFTAGVSNPNPDVIVLSYGHNGDLTGGGPYSLQPYRQLAFFNGIADKLTKNLPNVPVVMIGQNPSIYNNGSNPSNTNDGFMETRLSYLRPFAARRGWGFVNVHDAFLQSGTALVDLLSDSLHPNATGSQLWADTVWAAMRASSAINRPGSAQTPLLLKSWANYFDFSEWSANNVTLTKQTGAGRFETEGQAVTATITSTASAGWLSLSAIGADDVAALRGRLVTFSVWQRIPDTSASNAGRIEIVDSGGTSTSSGALKGDGFVLFTVTRLIDAAASSVTLYLYPADSSATPASVIDIDRASLALGADAIDPMRPADLAGRRVKIFGGSSAGIGVLRNGSATTAGLRFVPNEDSSAATAWTADFRPDGFSVKTTAQTHDRYTLTPVGGLLMGSGTAVQDMGLDRQTSGVMRLTGADLWSDSDGTRYLGGVTKQWRAAFLKDGVYVSGNLVLRGQGAAVADATGAGDIVAQFNTLLSRLRAHGLIAT